jgi:hypothetical protein
MAIGYDEPAALDVVARIGRDSMPQVRVLVLEQLSAGAEATTPDLANETNLPVSTVRIVVEDLTAIGVVERLGARIWAPLEAHPGWAQHHKGAGHRHRCQKTRKVGRPYINLPLSPYLVTFRNCEGGLELIGGCERRGQFSPPNTQRALSRNREKFLVVVAEQEQG